MSGWETGDKGMGLHSTHRQHRRLKGSVWDEDYIEKTQEDVGHTMNAPYRTAPISTDPSRTASSSSIITTTPRHAPMHRTRSLIHRALYTRISTCGVLSTGIGTGYKPGLKSEDETSAKEDSREGLCAIGYSMILNGFIEWGFGNHWGRSWVFGGLFLLLRSLNLLSESFSESSESFLIRDPNTWVETSIPLPRIRIPIRNYTPDLTSKLKFTNEQFNKQNRYQSPRMHWDRYSQCPSISTPNAPIPPTPQYPNASVSVHHLEMPCI
ncbi:hypothetical protein F5879DRAFT_995191 [Lentinula edodes]|nr:hypothetical protein F5879DRAFT_995191 [Lentinula edodes]